MAIDAVSATIVARRTSQIKKHTEVDRNKLIPTVIYWFLQNPSTAASERTWARPPATWMVWIHWIYAAGGASGSITMVVVFVGCLQCCGWTRDVTSSSYVKRYERITLRLGYGCHKVSHPGLHHTFCYCKFNVSLCLLPIWGPNW